MNNRSTAKGGNLVPALCSLAGTLILLSVIASCLPVTVPRLMGYEIYNVVSGSMEPEIPIGSILYVEKIPPEEIREDDVIAFWSNDWHCPSGGKEQDRRGNFYDKRGCQCRRRYE